MVVFAGRGALKSVVSHYQFTQYCGVIFMNTVERWKQEKHPLDVIEDVEQYAADELSFEEIEARAGDGEWERLKWAGMYAQKQEGYFMIRTKVPGGKLTPEQAEVIGE